MILLCLAILLQEHVPGNSVIRNPAGRSEIVIRTTERLAGAIDSLTWDGKEFINSTDHGRQLQSASNLDAGSPLAAETYNPTEAGSRDDGAGPRSTSVLLSLHAEGNTLVTRTRMAFWLRPGETSDGHPARNTTPLSRHLLTKTVTIGIPGLPHVIDYRTTFSVPEGERHTTSTFEALTGYMPWEFSRFLVYDPQSGQTRPLSAGPGEQPLPLIFATESGSHAMGIYSPDQPSPGFETSGYGRFKFASERVVKWNCVFRVKKPEGLPAGDYPFRNFVAVGTLEDVIASLKRLHDLHPRRK